MISISNTIPNYGSIQGHITEIRKIITISSFTGISKTAVSRLAYSEGQGQARGSYTLMQLSGKIITYALRMSPWLTTKRLRSKHQP